LAAGVILQEDTDLFNICFVETHMNGRSHPNHENRQKNVKITMVPRFRPLRGTAGQFGIFLNISH